MRYIRQNDVVYAICEEDIQNEAEERLGRKLTEEELLGTVDRLSDGIGESLHFIYNAVFEDLK